MTVSVWDRVAGQERAVALLRRVAERPVHAYLLVGARGSGVEDAARCFAAALVAPDDERAADLALRGMHPDIVEFEPEGAGFRVNEDVRQRIIPEASRSPIEGARKVIVLYEADRLNANVAVSANALLKTIEEPPPRTVMLLVTSMPDELPETVRSRCQRVDLAPLSDAVIRAAARAGRHPGRPRRAGREPRRRAARAGPRARGAERRPAARVRRHRRPPRRPGRLRGRGGRVAGGGAQGHGHRPRGPPGRGGRGARRRARGRGVPRPLPRDPGQAPRRAAPARAPGRPASGARRGHHRAGVGVPRRPGRSRRAPAQPRPARARCSTPPPRPRRWTPAGSPASRSSATPTRACSSSASSCTSRRRTPRSRGGSREYTASPRRDSSVGRAAHS